MKRYLFWSIFVIQYLFWAAISLSSCTQGAKSSTLTIAAASSFKYTLDELVKKFTAETKIECELVFASSGKLCAQITQGAPYDVFLSANHNYAQKLYSRNLTTQEPMVFAFGSLVLWTMNKNLNLKISQLKNTEVKRIAIANPKTAPFGEATMELLQKRNLLAPLREKLIYGESISQTNQFILTGSVDVGFTSRSVVSSTQMSGKGFWIELEPAEHQPIEHVVVIIRRDKQKMEKASLFSDFLFSKTAQNILNDFGYSIHLSE